MEMFSKIANKLTRSVETKTIILFGIIVCIFLFFDVTLAILSNFIKWINENESLIITLKFLLINMVLLICFILLFKKLSTIMKDNLNYYFINNWKEMRLAFLITFVHFSMAFFARLVEFIFNINDDEMIRKPESYKDYIRVLFLLDFIILNVWRFLYKE